MQNNSTDLLNSTDSGLVDLIDVALVLNDASYLAATGGDFEAEGWSIFLGCSLVEILKLKFG